MHINFYIHLCIYVYTYAYVYVCGYINIHIDWYRYINTNSHQHLQFLSSTTIFVLILSLNIFTFFLSVSGETSYNYLQSIFFLTNLIVYTRSPIAATAQVPCGNTHLKPTQLLSSCTLNDNWYIAAWYLVNVGIIEKINCGR